MCEPVITLAIAAASAYASVDAQSKQAKAQDQANQVQFQNSMTAYRANLANIEVERNQRGADATQKINENNAASRAAQSHARVAAGEAGVAGLSVDALLRDLAGEAAYDNTNVEENYVRADMALNAKRENAYNVTASDINSLRTPVSPDYLGAGLRIANAGVSSYKSYQNSESIKRGERPIY